MNKESEPFEYTVLQHLDAAFNLAHWLTGNSADAEDLVQEACLRALKYYGGFQGINSRAWLLTIVRNTYYTWQRNRSSEITSIPLDEIETITNRAPNPEETVSRNDDHLKLRRALEHLPLEFREVIILRELEGFSYKEIADITSVPIGTVMSRLARGRKILFRAFDTSGEKEDAQ